MPDNLKPEDRQRAMRAVKGKGTSLERRLAGMLAGLRFAGWRKNLTQVPGKPDAAFLRERVAIFMDGCFWHACPLCKRKLPQSNANYWRHKIRRNRIQASAVNRSLRYRGWAVVRIWEHEMRTPHSREAARTRIKIALSKDK
jgi:DNA mismatch endonuclease (patch repair protein)